MSRGLGRIERAILDALAEIPGASVSTKTLVAKVFGTAPAGPCIPHGATRTQVASVARAVRSLARKGLVVVLPSGASRRRRQVRAYPAGPQAASFGSHSQVSRCPPQRVHSSTQQKR